MTPTDIQAILGCPGLTRYQRTLLRRRFIEQQSCAQIATATGRSYDGVKTLVSRIVRKAKTWTVPTRIDEAWHARQVAYVRSLEHDAEHQGRYLRGIAVAHGDEVASRVEAEAK